MSERNEFGIKKKNNLLCLLCRKYVLKKKFNEHLPDCEYNFKQKTGIK